MMSGYGAMLSGMGEDQTAPGELERLRAFVNTADFEADREALTDPAAARTWMIESGLADDALSVSRAELRRTLALREALRAILLTHNHAAGVKPHPPEGPPNPPASDATPAEVLTATAARARIRLHFTSDGGAELVPEAGGVDGVLGRLLVIAGAAMDDGTWPRLKACRDPGCAWAFYDATRNRSRAWCDMQVCGNRAKARAFRRRQAYETASSA